MRKQEIVRLTLIAIMGAAGCTIADPDESSQTFATSTDALCTTAANQSCGCRAGDDHADLRNPSGMFDGSCAQDLAGSSDSVRLAGSIETAGDADFFKFRTPGGYKTFSFRVSNQSGQLVSDVFCEVYTSPIIATRWTFNNDITVADRSCRIAWTTSLAQNYYFKVTHATGGTGTYAAWIVMPAVGEGGGDELGIVDVDNDGYPTENIEGPVETPDNCPTIANPSQADFDQDGIGDACDSDCPANPACEGSDGDSDGIDDAADNCPGTANADQLNTDGDTQGNACDSDDDNDGIDDSIDNCSLTANLNQADLDADLVGDACDTDLDGDGALNDADNCPIISNPDQANSDGDANGNACDIDDDNDGIVDLVDNCQFIANANQADFDHDGIGDKCDADQDSDGVLNTSDVCPDSPRGKTISHGIGTNGCTGAQIVVLRCPGPTSFPNHGGYVSCVSGACDEAIGLGVMTGCEKGRIVSAAAHTH